METQWGRGRLRALDDSFDRLLRRHGTSLTGDHAGAERSSSRSVFSVYLAVIVVVAVARLIGGGDPVVVVLGAVGFAVACWFLVRRQSRLAALDATTRQRRAVRHVRIGGVLLAAMGAGFAVAGIWQVGGLLVLLAAFFNGAVWFIKRHQNTRNALQK